MAKTGNVVRAGIGLAVASGGEPRIGGEDQRSGGPVVDLQSNFKTIRVWSKTSRIFIWSQTSTNVHYTTTNPILG